MTDDIRVLGIAPQARDHQLSTVFAVAERTGEEEVVELPDPWQGGAGTSLPQQLFNLRETLLSLIDSRRPTVICVRRPETAGRGGPTLAYDEKVASLALAAFVSAEHSLRYLDRRGNQLKPHPSDAAVERHCPADHKGRRDPLQLAATAAALTALRSAVP